MEVKELKSEHYSIFKAANFTVDEIVDDEQRIVTGWITVEVIDRQADKIPVNELIKVMPIVMERGGTILYSHSSQHVGKILDWKPDRKDGKPAVWVKVQIFHHYTIDDQVWEGIKEGRINGFSMGGRAKGGDLKCDGALCWNELKDIEVWENSLVERPANQESILDHAYEKQDEGYVMVKSCDGIQKMEGRPRTFRMVRNGDESGVSGTGHVLDGAVFPDGRTVINWCVDGQPNSTTIFSSFNEFKQIHIDSHPGNRTEIVWDNGDRLTKGLDTETKEKLAEVEHEQWEKWTREISEELTECIAAMKEGKTEYAMEKLAEMNHRWRKNWKPYDDLPEHEKDKDREASEDVTSVLEEGVEKEQSLRDALLAYAESTKDATDKNKSDSPALSSTTGMHQEVHSLKPHIEDKPEDVVYVDKAEGKIPAGPKGYKQNLSEPGTPQVPMSKEEDKDGRPEGAWFDSCVQRANSFADDAKAFCNALWHEGPEGMRSSFGKSLSDNDISIYKPISNNKKLLKYINDESNNGIKVKASELITKCSTCRKFVWDILKMGGTANQAIDLLQLRVDNILIEKGDQKMEGEEQMPAPAQEEGNGHGDSVPMEDVMKAMLAKMDDVCQRVDGMEEKMNGYEEKMYKMESMNLTEDVGNNPSGDAEVVKEMDANKDEVGDAPPAGNEDSKQADHNDPPIEPAKENVKPDTLDVTTVEKMIADAVAKAKADTIADFQKQGLVVAGETPRPAVAEAGVQDSGLPQFQKSVQRLAETTEQQEAGTAGVPIKKQLNVATASDEEFGDFIDDLQNADPGYTRGFGN